MNTCTGVHIESFYDKVMEFKKLPCRARLMNTFVFYFITWSTTIEMIWFALTDLKIGHFYDFQLDSNLRVTSIFISLYSCHE